jgi:hypothetical protein
MTMLSAIEHKHLFESWLNFGKDHHTAILMSEWIMKYSNRNQRDRLATVYETIPIFKFSIPVVEEEIFNLAKLVLNDKKDFYEHIKESNTSSRTTEAFSLIVLQDEIYSTVDRTINFFVLNMKSP